MELDQEMADSKKEIADSKKEIADSKKEIVKLDQNITKKDQNIKIIKKINEELHFLNKIAETSSKKLNEETREKIKTSISYIEKNYTKI